METLGREFVLTMTNLKSVKKFVKKRLWNLEMRNPLDKKPFTIKRVLQVSMLYTFSFVAFGEAE